MVQRWAVASGNWSNTATWNGGTLPGSTDDVYANNFTVTIDQDVTANSLNIVAGTTAVAGGTFQCSTTRTIALQTLAVGAYSTGTSPQLLLLSGGSVTLTVAGAISADTTTAGNEPRAVQVTGGTHSITSATFVGGAGFAMEINGAATVTLTSAVQGGTGSANAVLLSNANAQVTVNGSVTGGSLVPAIQATLGVVRLNADLIYGPTGVAPVTGASGSGGVMFVRGGANLAVTAPSDDNWPLATGSSISLTEGGGGGGVDPKRFLNVAGVATAIQ